MTDQTLICVDCGATYHRGGKCSNCTSKKPLRPLAGMSDDQIADIGIAKKLDERRS